jgi:acetoin utilization deacetylase AcuC-like enzyme
MAPSNTGLFYDDRVLDHDTGRALISAAVDLDSVWDPQAHVESPARIRRAHDLLTRTGVIDKLTPISATAATDDDLLLVHTEGHLERISAAAAAGPGVAGDYAPVSTSSDAVARLAAGACIATVDAVVSGTVDRAYVLVRPPGHHATPDEAMGYCLYNSVAVAARHAQQRSGVERVAIVDWDVHHGNGTQAAFRDDPNVLFVSVHQDDWYPVGSGPVSEVGVGEGEGFTINIPLYPGAGDAAYEAAFGEIVTPAIRAFSPDLILVSAGQDPSAFDPLGRMLVSSDGFRALTRIMGELAAEICEGRLAVVQEGGYSADYGPVCTWAIVEELSGVRSGYEDPHLGWLRATAGTSRVSDDQRAVLANVRSVHERYELSRSAAR